MSVLFFLMTALFYIALFPLRLYDAYRARQWRKRQEARDAFVRAQDRAMGLYAGTTFANCPVVHRPLSDRLAAKGGQTIEEICAEALMKSKAGV